jgi:hypothetical protein
MTSTTDFDCGKYIKMDLIEINCENGWWMGLIQVFVQQQTGISSFIPLSSTLSVFISWICIKYY